MPTHNVTLCPRPTFYTPQPGACHLPEGPLLVAVMDEVGRPAADWLMADPHLAVTYTDDTDAAHICLWHSDETAEQGYGLFINENGIAIFGDAAGLFYGVCTLRQIIQQQRPALACAAIQDHPDNRVRGIMLDISRDKVPTLPTLYDLIDLLASLKINQLQLYTEHTFAYAAHPAVWRDASPLTADDIRQLDAYCRARFIELVPNQNSLGHMERWLKHPAYQALAECEDGFTTPWGEQRGPSTLNVLDPASFDLVRGLYDDLLPHFTSRTLNVGCDEPWELGRCKTRDAFARQGGRLYLDWLLKLHADLRARGITMQFWGDIIIGYPDLIPELPPDVVVMDWGYEATHPFAQRAQRYADTGLPFYLCPGTSSWNSLLGRTDNALHNIHQASAAAAQHNAVGVLVTDWGDNGHLQPLPVSYLGFVAAATYAWNPHRPPDIPAMLDRLVFHDDAGIMGQAVYDLGNLYREIGPQHINGQLAAYALWAAPDALHDRIAHLTTEVAPGETVNIAPDNLRRYHARLDDLLAGLDLHQMQRPDADLILRELRLAGHWLQLGAARLLRTQGAAAPFDIAARTQTLLAQQRDVWLARHRPGGLADSLARINRQVP